MTLKFNPKICRSPSFLIVLHPCMKYELARLNMYSQVYKEYVTLKSISVFFFLCSPSVHEVS